MCAARGRRGCAARWKTWGPSSSSSARPCRRGATCCRTTLPTNWSNCRIRSHPSPAPTPSASSSRHSDGRSWSCLPNSTKTPSPRLRWLRYMRRGCTAATPWWSRSYGRASTAASAPTSTCWSASRRPPSGSGRKPDGSGLSTSLPSSARRSSMNSIWCAKPPTPPRSGAVSKSPRSSTFRASIGITRARP